MHYGMVGICMSDLEHARQLLTIAHRDLKALGGMLNPDILRMKFLAFMLSKQPRKL